MADKRLIKLAVNFDKAPQNITQAATELNESYERVEKAKIQNALWQKELELAERDVVKNQRTLDLAIGRWEIKQGVDEPALEEAKK